MHSVHLQRNQEGLILSVISSNLGQNIDFYIQETGRGGRPTGRQHKWEAVAACSLPSEGSLPLSLPLPFFLPLSLPLLLPLPSPFLFPFPFSSSFSFPFPFLFLFPFLFPFPPRR